MERNCSKFITRDKINKSDFNLDSSYNNLRKLPKKYDILKKRNKKGYEIYDFNNKETKSVNFNIKIYIF